MWSNAENIAGSLGYDISNIEQLLSGKSKSTAHGIRKMLYMDFALKAIVMIVLGIDIFLYLGTVNVIFVCSAGIILLAGLLFLQKKMLDHFNIIADNRQNTRNNLMSMLTYLKTKFNLTLITISITYIFIFIAGSLIYFYMVYGEVRPLDEMDIIVFTGFILMGIIFNFVVNKALVQYQIKHLEVCLTDLNEDALLIVSQNIEMQKKQDRTNKFMLGMVLLIGFLLLVAIFKNVLG